MPRRLGFWTLLITSTLWVQGCAHNIEKQQKSIQQKLIGTWSCVNSTQAEGQSLGSSIKGTSTLRFTDTQIFSDGVSMWHVSPKGQASSEQVNIRHSYVASYTLIDEPLPKIVFYVSKGSMTQLSDNKRIKKLAFHSDPNRRNEANITRLTDKSLSIQSVEPNKNGSVSTTKTECTRKN